MVVTPRVHTDSTTVLTPACHAWLTHDSHVDYGGSRLLKAGRIREGLVDGRCVLEKDLSKGVLERVRAGLQRSPRAIPQIQQYCASRCS